MPEDKRRVAEAKASGNAGSCSQRQQQKEEAMSMRIVKEDLTGCINRTAAGATAFRHWVIETPINESGICKKFKSEEEAQQFIQETGGINNGGKRTLTHL